MKAIGRSVMYCTLQNYHHSEYGIVINSTGFLILVKVTIKLFELFNSIEFIEHQPCIVSRLSCNFTQSDTLTLFLGRPTA